VTLSGLPNGIDSSLPSPFMLSPGTPQQIAFSAPATAGTFAVEFQGASGTIFHSASATLSVAPQPNPFLVSASYYGNGVNFGLGAGHCPGGAGTLRVNLLPPELPILGAYDSSFTSASGLEDQVPKNRNSFRWLKRWRSGGDCLLASHLVLSNRSKDQGHKTSLAMEC
jgi:hypothetical protein